jgi:hypothetical protein
VIDESLASRMQYLKCLSGERVQIPRALPGSMTLSLGALIVLPRSGVPPAITRLQSNDIVRRHGCIRPVLTERPIANGSHR